MLHKRHLVLCLTFGVHFKIGALEVQQKNAYLQAKLHESLLSSAILFALNLQMCNFCSNFAARLHDSSQP